MNMGNAAVLAPRRSFRNVSQRTVMTRLALVRASAVGLVLSVWAPAAFAQDAATEAAPAEAPAAPAVAAPTPEAVKEAGERYGRGLSLYSEGEYLLALVEFERAYQLAPNYRVLYNIGQVRIQLGRYAKARDALEEYLRQGGSEINADRTKAVTKDLEFLAERTAKLGIISSQDGADVAIDGIVMGTAPLKAAIVVDAGEHTVEVRKPGFYAKTQQVTLAGRDEIELKIDLIALPEAKPQTVVERHTERVVAPEYDNSMMWIGWATTGTLAVGAGVVGYLGITKANELESMRTDYGVTRSQLDQTKSDARTLFMISDIAAGAAVIAGGISLYLTLSGGSERPATTTTSPKAAKGREVKLGVVPNGVRVTGTF